MNTEDLRKKLKSDYHYIYIEIDDFKPELIECDGCNARVPVMLYENASVRHRFEGAPGHLLCDLCASTSTGSAVSYPGQFLEGRCRSILQTICYTQNAVLDQLGKFEHAPSLSITYDDLEKASAQEKKND